jgi:hypothetical protein
MILSATHSAQAQSQNFDHESYPKLDFNFQSLKLDLGIQPQNLRIDGAANYQLKANVSEADTITLYAGHMDISAVSVDGNAMNYSLQNDSLFVPLDDPSQKGQQYNLSIRYSGNPKFGLLKNNNQTVWSSQLPMAQRHWIPIVDNPQVELETTFNISVPSGFQVWATGQKTNEEAASVDVMRYQFKSNGEVPASSLSLAVGKFNSVSTSAGVKKINVAVEQTLSDLVNSQQLLERAYSLMGSVEDSLGREYPYSRLNVIVLSDHSAETKQWAATTVYVYKNRGNLEAQLLRGIIGQWMGTYQRAAQWDHSDAITLYQTLLHRTLTDSSRQLEQTQMPDFPSTIYDRFGVEYWNRWLKGWQEWQNEPVKNVIADARNAILESLPRVTSWSDYAEYWYRQSGQPLFEVPELRMIRDSTSSTPQTSSDSVAYEIKYTLNESEGNLKLRFDATAGVFNELTSIRAYEIYPNRTDTAKVTFTGARDSVMLQIDPMISTLRLEAPNHPNLYLEEYKPAPFLIFEYRNAGTAKERAAAARKLGYHAENPDLQLAIKDFMSKETEPAVRAALLRSFADITSGATGTEQVFLEALANENEAIRNAALMSLQNYEGNKQVSSRVQSVAQNAETFMFFRKATEVYTTLASAEQFRNFAEGVSQQDSTGHRAIFVIQQLANIGEVEEAVGQASLFATEEYSYQVRRMALDILIQHDHTPSDWLARAKNLLDTADPRIRFLVIRGLARNQNQEVTDFLSSYSQDEYDARVHKHIQQVLDE